MKHTILCIDDEPNIVDALERIFRRKFRVLKATTPEDALEILQKEDVTVIISDQRMPHMTGVELLHRSLETHPFAVRILLTGYADMNSVIDAINSGHVYRYITKPWDTDDLTIAVDQAVERYELMAELKEKNESLSKALDELKSLDKAKNHFMILINHELKTPLTSMINFLDLLKETKLDTEQEKYTKRITASTEKLTTLINEVLELIAAETGQSLPKTKKFSVSEIIESLNKELLDDLGLRNQKLEFTGDDHKISADPQKIRAVIRRLVLNAIKFGNKNSDILVTTAATPDLKVKVEVANQGSEIKKDVIEHILKPFSLNEDVMNHSTGFGLGLSISQAQLKQHNSTLDFTYDKKQVKVSFLLPSI